jgi:formate hydrogenlyase transcriptional activator
MLPNYLAGPRPASPAVIPRIQEPLNILRVAFDGAPHGILVCKEDGTILFANMVASSIFSYPPGELVGQRLSRLLPEPTAVSSTQSWTEFWTKAHGQAIVAGRTIAGIRRDGSMVALELGLNLLVEGSTRYLIASVVDASERLNLERGLAAATRAHVDFEQLVADIAAQFGAVDPEGIDATVHDALRQIGECLKPDWAAMWHKKADEEVAVPTHVWTRAKATAAPGPFALDTAPAVKLALEAGESCNFAALEDFPDEETRAALQQYGLQSAVMIPTVVAGGPAGAMRILVLGATAPAPRRTAAAIERLRLVAGVMNQAFSRMTAQDALQNALGEIRQLRDRLALDNVELRREVKVLRTSRPIVSESARIQQILAQVEQVAPTPATVLLMGETGTGKEVMAQAIHDLSPRHQRPMVRVSCAAIPTALIESELFGRERGAYTGALSRQIGRFEAAHQSTLFLDEIGDLPAEVQVKLLRVLQERVIERLGSTQPIKVDVRIIAATNRNLEEAVRDKTFREDLFYRLNVFPIVMPPLRERIEDIPALVWTFVDEFSRSFGKAIDSISKDSMGELQRYPWPGNVRELRNVIERAVIVCNQRQLVVTAPRLGERPMPQGAMTLAALEVEHIRGVLESTSWRVRGRGGAAERLGLKPTTLESRMARLGILRKQAN